MADVRYTKILDDMQEGYYEVDLKGNFLFLNTTAFRMTGYSPEDVIGHNFKDFSDTRAAVVIEKAIARIFDSGIPQRLEYELLCKDGAKLPIENSISLMKDASGFRIGFNGLINDISQRKTLQDDLKKSHERLEAIFENANDLIITTDKDGYIRRLNKKVEEVSGYSRDELVGKSILAVADPAYRNLYIRFWHDIVPGQTPRYELGGLSRDGQRVHLLSSGSALRENGKIIEVVYSAQVITDIKAAQQTIENLKNYLKSIIESSPILMICLDEKGLIEMANPVSEMVFALEQNRLVGSHICEVASQVSDLPQMLETVRQTRQPCSITEQPLSSRNRNLFDITLYPLKPAPNSGIVLSAIDVTEKKNMELQLIQAQKMETIGEMTGGFAHDFNNILTGISGNIDMLKLENDPVKCRHYLNSLSNIADRARDMIKQMLIFSKKNEGVPQDIALCEVLNDVIEMTSQTIPRNIQLRFDDSTCPMCVHMDKTQLTQVFLNIIINARDAIGDSQDGLISVKLNSMNIDADLKRHYLLEDTGNYARIDISDNGCGIRKNILARIFDPFFTTKDQGQNKGTGLGLSITYTIVKNAGGSIRVTSQRGKGSTFSILLPQSENTNTQSQEDKMHQTERKARILLVDDEEMLLEIGQEMLEFLGHEVITASDGRQCIETLKANPGKFDIVILDMIMPNLDGAHTLALMAQENIDARIIVSSGFSFEDDQAEILSNPLVAGKLNKPFKMTELSKVLADILG